jgi:hypothetical protein
MIYFITILLLALTPLASAFVTPLRHGGAPSVTRFSTQRQMAEGEKVAKQVTGEELEQMLQEWDTPLVIDAYATW